MFPEQNNDPYFRKCIMARQWTLLLAALVFCASQSSAQTSAQDFTFQVSTAQPWTDTGLDLQSGDVLEISASAVAAAVPDRHAVAGSPACDPGGVSAATADLPLPSVPAGALIARLHSQGAAPVLVGAFTELRLQEPSHLFLGMNMAGTPSCQGSLAVKVHRTSTGSTPASSTSPGTSSGTSSGTPSNTTGGQSQKRSEQLKSQLASAAQVFMSGQFGASKIDSSANSSSAVSSGNTAVAGTSAASSPLKVSDAPLDSDLRKSLDSLPRRVNDQFNNLGDMVNFAIVGSQKDVQAALDAANWHVADSSTKKALFNALEETYDNKDYLQMPMSTLYLFGRKQDFGYEMAEPIAMVASRHHFRIWKAPFTWKGQEVWVGAGTHDIGFAKDKRNGEVTHKIDPAVDGERDNIGSSLQKAGKAETLTYYLPPNPVQGAKNATGDGYNSDGRLLVIFLQ
ncbi:MAG: LssY C-terminal domain-containing protein [Candidatus Sulfotelmatobacter sp.]